MFTFKEGRQGAGYEVMTLFSVKLPFAKLRGFDLHVLRYKSGTNIPSHVDKVASGKHHRINWVIKHPVRGGKFRCDHCHRVTKNIIYFRPDLYHHEVTKVRGGSRVAISFGWVTDN